MISISRRLLLSTSLVLAAFFGLTGLTLDRAFHEHALRSLRERLQTQIYSLLAAADLDPGGRLQLPAALPEPRFSIPHSGLYGEVTDAAGNAVWRSQSLSGTRLLLPSGLPPAASSFYEPKSTDRPRVYALGYGVVWETESGRPQPYTFSVAEQAGIFDQQAREFRRSLWAWLGGVSVLLLLVQGVVLRWGLHPLRGAEHDLAEIEAGRRERLEGSYPRELRGLTDNLNALLSNDRASLERYRRSLGDLAHSLKTPLAVLRSAAEGEGSPLAHSVDEQVSRMSQIVEYQLHRAATSGRSSLAAPIALRRLTVKVVASLSKVYADKGVQTAVKIPESAEFRGDEGDLLEILGNLLDNAYKWCRTRVRVDATAADGTLMLRVDDDGPGIPPQEAIAVLGRGVRGDQATGGHGIGLSVVRDIVEAYGGRLEVGSGPLGGARISATFPRR